MWWVTPPPGSSTQGGGLPLLHETARSSTLCSGAQALIAVSEPPLTASHSMAESSVTAPARTRPPAHRRQPCGAGRHARPNHADMAAPVTCGRVGLGCRKDDRPHYGPVRKRPGPIFLETRAKCHIGHTTSFAAVGQAGSRRCPGSADKNSP